MAKFHGYDTTASIGAVLNGEEFWFDGVGREDFNLTDLDGECFRPVLSAEQAGVLAAFALAGAVIVDEDREECHGFVCWSDDTVSVETSYHDGMVDNLTHECEREDYEDGEPEWEIRARHDY